MVASTQEGLKRIRGDQAPAFDAIGTDVRARDWFVCQGTVPP